MKLSTFVLTAVISFSTITTAQASTPRFRSVLGNVLHHKVNSHHRHHGNHHQVQPRSRHQVHRRRNHRSVHHGGRQYHRPHRFRRLRHNPYRQHHKNFSIYYYK